MNRFRLIDEVSIFLHDCNNCHITVLYLGLKDVCTFYREVWSRPLPEQNCLSPQNCHMMIILGCGKTCFNKAESISTFSVFLSLFQLILLSECCMAILFSLGMNSELLLLFKFLSCCGELQLKHESYLLCGLQAGF